ncbi:hypothetical protein [Aeromonas media]|uniref:hypothetical protein n=1 Tax=Aeromonas media TaxID=651 RepID=UPI0029DA939F|nr:hypothetical protein [Aeromonas media]MDX7899455.1 hypothetical protein [Aeromonas media]
MEINGEGGLGSQGSGYSCCNREPLCFHFHFPYSRWECDPDIQVLITEKRFSDNRGRLYVANFATNMS